VAGLDYNSHDAAHHLPEKMRDGKPQDNENVKFPHLHFFNVNLGRESLSFLCQIDSLLLSGRSSHPAQPKNPHTQLHASACCKHSIRTEIKPPSISTLALVISQTFFRRAWVWPKNSSPTNHKKEKSKNQ